jgi:hypothetical protein
MLRALEDPSKNHGPIQAPNGDPDGRDRRTGHERRPDPNLRGQHHSGIRGLPVTRPAVYSRTLRSMYRHPRLRPRPPPVRVNVCTYVTKPE